MRATSNNALLKWQLRAEIARCHSYIWHIRMSQKVISRHAPISAELPLAQNLTSACHLNVLPLHPKCLVSRRGGLLQDDLGILCAFIGPIRNRPVGPVPEREHDRRYNADHKHPRQKSGEATAKRRAAVLRPIEVAWVEARHPRTLWLSRPDRQVT